MTKFWLTIGVVSFLLIGCADGGSDNETQDTSGSPEAATEENSSAVAKEGEDVEFTVTEPEGAGQVQEKSTTAGLNPPHGEPGHDCAIAVGAPLDGSGGQAQPTITPAAQPAAQPNLNVQPNFNSGAPASGNLNPPHGQPGHDCAVAVGAPLPAK